MSTTIADAGFHAGELSVQQKAGVLAQAARLSVMVEPAGLGYSLARFLAGQTLAVITARDAAGRLWTSPLAGEPGFLEPTARAELTIHANFAAGDPLHGLPAGQQAGLVVVDFGARRRARINGTLVETGTEGLVVEVEQAYGNCPQYIKRRDLTPAHPVLGDTRRGAALEPNDIAQIRTADTFFLGTDNPGRGRDASHRGGEPGVVLVDGNQLWWPDYAGNTMFNSFGNLAIDPAAALLFLDFRTGRTLQLSGTAELEWGRQDRPGDDGHTGRVARFTVVSLVAGHLLAARETEHGVDFPSW
jgi:predicted pyridoxine 5'-phosphate oxidase superfamily flavin-nucleotide-binding protein